MGILAQLVMLFFSLIYLVVIGGIVLSWVKLAVGNASWLYHPAVRMVDDLSFRILRPFRKVFQMIGLGRMPIDLSPILALWSLDLVKGLILRMLLPLG